MTPVHAPPRPADLERLIATRAAAQRGLILVSDIKRLGMSSSTLSKHIRRGRYMRIHPSVIAVGVSSLDFETRVLAAILEVGGTAVATARCAAILWRIDRRFQEVVEVLAAHRHRPLPKVDVHSTIWLPWSDRTQLRDVPITTPTRTIVELADQVGPHRLAAVLHEAAFRKRLDVPGLRRAADRHRHRRGHPSLDRALELHLAGSAGTRSNLEDRFLGKLLAAGIPEPIVNTFVTCPSASVEPDFRWEQARLVAMLDAPPTHDRPRDRRKDAQDDEALRSAGYRVLHVPDDLMDEGIHKIREHLRATNGAGL